MRRAPGIVLAMGLASAAWAEAPATSPRPAPRPDAAAPAVILVAASQAAPAVSLRPLPRPRKEAVIAAPEVAPQPAAVEAPPRDPLSALFQTLTGTRPAAAAAAPAAVGSALAVARSPRPEARPKGNALVRRAAAITAPRATSREGSVCGVAEIKGQAIGPVPGNGACGIDDAVRVISVSGVALSQQPTIDCTTAKALNSWVREGVIPAVGNTGGGVAKINIVAHYICRGRNNKKGARLSEHSFGRAVDVAAIVLKDGTRLTVEDHWSSGKYGKIIKAMHKSACGPFGTVLGPGSDGYHEDHLHVDTARYRGGPYCR